MRHIPRLEDLVPTRCQIFIAFRGKFCQVTLFLIQCPCVFKISESHRITQEDLNDLAGELYQSKHQSELLSSRLKQCNLVTAEVHITIFMTRNIYFARRLNMEKGCTTTELHNRIESIGKTLIQSAMSSFLIHKYQIIKSVSENCYEDMEYRI